MKKQSYLKNGILDGILFIQTVLLYNFGSQEFNTLITVKLTSTNNAQEELDEFTKDFQRDYHIENLKYIAVLDFNTSYAKCDCIHLFTNISTDKTNYITENHNHLFAINVIPTYQTANVFFRILANSIDNSYDLEKIVFDKNLEYPTPKENI